MTTLFAKNNLSALSKTALDKTEHKFSRRKGCNITQ